MVWSGQWRERGGAECIFTLVYIRSSVLPSLVQYVTNWGKVGGRVYDVTQNIHVGQGGNVKSEQYGAGKLSQQLIMDTDGNQLNVQATDLFI